MVCPAKIRRYIHSLLFLSFNSLSSFLIFTFVLFFFYRLIVLFAVMRVPFCMIVCAIFMSVCQLVDMMLHEVMDMKPNVRWDDIAGTYTYVVVLLFFVDFIICLLSLISISFDSCALYRILSSCF